MTTLTTLVTQLQEKICKDDKLRLRKVVLKFNFLRPYLTKLTYVKNLLEEHDISARFIEDTKSDVEVLHRKRQADNKLKNKEYLVALKLYTRCIALANSSEMLASLYIQRAKCSFELGLYSDCIKDIDRGLTSKCLPKLRKELINKRNHCTRMRRLTRKEESWYGEIPRISSPERNPHIQSAKSCIEIRVNEEYGRHIVASRDIEIGEVVAVEKPYAFVAKEETYIHCSECLMLSYSLLPCQTCTQVFYCSEACRDKAFSSYHQYECRILLSLVTFQIDVLLHLALKLAFLTKERYSEVNDKKFDQLEQPYRSDRYKEIHNLMSVTERNISNILFRCALTTICIFKLVKDKTNFFDARVQENTFKEILIHELVNVINNPQPVLEFTRGSDFKFRREQIGLGAYSLLGLFNHSCCSNIDKYFYGPNLVLRASNTIKKGEQCFVDYLDINYFWKLKDHRRELLIKHFFFDCNCRACRENWQVCTPDAWSDYFRFIKKCEGYDREKIRTFLTPLIKELKTIEVSEPNERVAYLKCCILHCFSVLGNRRLV